MLKTNTFRKFGRKFFLEKAYSSTKMSQVEGFSGEITKFIYMYMCVRRETPLPSDRKLTCVNVCVFLHVRLLVEPFAAELTRIRSRV
jgi:hypothetical protein